MRNRWIIILVLIIITLPIISFTNTAVESQEGVFTIIYVSSDGSIKTDPPGIAVNLRRAGNLYYLIGDLYGKIIIEKDNVILDGRGYKLSGYMSGYEETAIRIIDRYNVTIMNLKIEFFHEAVYVENSTMVKIINNAVDKVDYGFTIYDSNNITFSNNIISNTFMYGISMLNTKFSEISFNTFMNSYQAIIARNSSNLMIIYNSIYGESTYCGFNLYLVRYSIIAHNLVEGRHGIILLLSDNNSIFNNIFSNSETNYFVRSGINSWSINPTQGVNIMGGKILGGNIYLLTDGSGFSQTCNDENEDGICDQPLVLDNSRWNIDYYPLKYYITNGTPTPVFFTLTETLTKTTTIILTETYPITKPLTYTTTIIYTSKPEAVTITKTETVMHSTTITTTIAITFVTTLNMPPETSTKVHTETFTVTHVYTTTPIEQIVSSIISTLVALILAIAAIAVLSILTPEKKQ
ncbi:MAG: NosD domain-containing protein [Desulfurococcaceae archaeon]